MYSLSMVEDVLVNLSLQLTVSVALQVVLLKLVLHVLQSLRLLITVSLSLWTVLLNVGEGIHVRDDSNGQSPSKVPKLSTLSSTPFNSP